MVVNVFIKNKLINKWFNNVVSELYSVIEFNIHTSVFSFTNELSLKMKSNVAIIDIDDLNYFHYTNEITKTNGNCLFIGIGLEKKCTKIKEVLNNNIIGYISIYEEPYIVMQCINIVMSSNYFFDTSIIKEIINIFKKDNNTAASKEEAFNKSLDELNGNYHTTALTEKEKRVCNLLTKGYSYKEIAEIVGLTTFAINKNSKSIFKKLGVRSRAEMSYKILY
jgi:DNA-binding NarL/FixJ family response regulator